jgi:hypothetical protein
MSSFTEALIAKKLHGDRWIVEKAFDYHVGDEASNDIVTVPKGFETDLASVPFPLTFFIPKDGTHTQAAVLHDWLYCSSLLHLRTRKECDLIFLEAMKVLKVPMWKRHIMYRAVRLFAFNPWDNYRKSFRQQEKKNGIS